MTAGVVKCDTNLDMRPIHLLFVTEMQQIWRMHNPSEATRLDITFHIEPGHGDTIDVRIGTIETMTDPQAAADDLQKGLASLIRRHRGWMCFVDIYVSDGSDTPVTSTDQSPYRQKV